MDSKRATFTPSAFKRAHGKAPTGRGTGTWAFQQTRTYAAFDADLFGEIEFCENSTLTEAMARLRRNGATGLWAILP